MLSNNTINLHSFSTYLNMPLFKLNLKLEYNDMPLIMNSNNCIFEFSTYVKYNFDIMDMIFGMQGWMLLYIENSFNGFSIMTLLLMNNWKPKAQAIYGMEIKDYVL